MNPERTCKTTLTKLVNELYQYHPESEYRPIVYELLDIIALTGTEEDNSIVEIEVSEQHETLIGFTIWTPCTIITTDRWPWSPSEKSYLPWTERIHVIPKTPYDEDDFEYKPTDHYVDTEGELKTIDEIAEELKDE